MAKWEQQTYKIPKNHNWHAKPGYNVFVADRGAVRFSIPSGWKVNIDEHGTSPAVPVFLGSAVPNLREVSP